MHFNHKATKTNETSRQEQKDQKGETSGVDSSNNNVAESDNTLDIPKNMQVSTVVLHLCLNAITCLSHSLGLDCSNEAITP